MPKVSDVEPEWHPSNNLALKLFCLLLRFVSPRFKLKLTYLLLRFVVIQEEDGTAAVLEESAETVEV